MIETRVVRARFDDFRALERALRALKESGRRDYEAYGPVNLTELEGLMPEKGSPVRVVATVGAITGLVGFFYMCVQSSLLYSLITGGKPPISRVPFVILAYEGTILLGALAAFFGCLVFARLFPGKRAEAYDPSVTSDSFGVRVRYRPDERTEVIDLLRNAGAVEINESQY